MNQTHVTLSLRFVKALRLCFKVFIYPPIYSIVLNKPDEKACSTMRRRYRVFALYTLEPERKHQSRPLLLLQTKRRTAVGLIRLANLSSHAACSCHFYLAIIHLRRSDDGTKQQVTFSPKQEPIFLRLPSKLLRNLLSRSSATLGDHPRSPREPDSTSAGGGGGGGG